MRSLHSSFMSNYVGDNSGIRRNVRLIIKNLKLFFFEILICDKEYSIH